MTINDLRELPRDVHVRRASWNKSLHGCTIATVLFALQREPWASLAWRFATDWILDREPIDA